MQLRQRSSNFFLPLRLDFTSFWRKNLVMKEKLTFQPLPSTGHIWRLAVTNWFLIQDSARQIDNRQIRPAFLPAGCNCDKKPLLNGRGGEMIEEERAKQTRLDPGNLLGCSKMALPDGRNHATKWMKTLFVPLTLSLKNYCNSICVSWSTMGPPCKDVNKGGGSSSF